MRNILCLLMILVSGTALAQAMTADEIAQAQRMAAEFQKDPKFKEQMKQIQQQMQKQGVKTEGMEQGMKSMTSMNSKNIESMMKMSECFQENISEEDMKTMSAKGKEINDKIKALCAAGKESQAEQATKAYGIKMRASREYLAMKQCSDKYKEALEDPSFQAMREQMQQVEGKKNGVCGNSQK